MSKTLTFAQILSSPVAASASAFYEKSHSGSKYQKSANFKFAQGDFTRFSIEVFGNSHKFVSGCLHFTFKICQTVAGTSACNADQSISRIFESRFWRVFDNWPNCESSFVRSLRTYSLWSLLLCFDGRSSAAFSKGFRKVGN